MSKVDIEQLFIEKFTQKYQLTERDLKKAFAKFDSDKNGVCWTNHIRKYINLTYLCYLCFLIFVIIIQLLDLAEVADMFKSFLNGFSEKDIQRTVANFDTSGDGKISYQEFLAYLTRPKVKQSVSSGSNNQQRPSSSTSNGGQQYQQKLQPSYDDPDLYSESYGSSSPRGSDNGYNSNNNNVNNNLNVYNKLNNDMSNINITVTDRDNFALSNAVTDEDAGDIDSMTRGYLRYLRTYLSKTCVDRNKLSTSEKLTNKTAADLATLKVSEYLFKEFQPYTGAGDGRARGVSQGVSYVDFCK